ncbi:flavin-containing monooxygenase [Rhodococcus gannanensis]|uniref:Flavin-containing monooxygenase n=1 Tax=Rhodococcus gannanensis TaxID=1960308 RepID=A0ABW4P953_9NOCA
MAVEWNDATMTTRVLVIGAGFAGLGMAAGLQAAGIDDFLVLERAADLGGVWRDNTYPGAACDVPSVLYSYSFARGDGWSAARARQPEILDHLRALARSFADHIEYGAEVVRGDWDEDAARWRVTTADGRTFEARILVAATGALNLPKRPRIPGADTFAGPALHTADWDDSVDLDGRRVAVVGTGASAAQLVPAIAARARTLDVYQRSPAWVLPPMGSAAPRLPRLARLAWYWRAEATAPAYAGSTVASALLRRRAMRHLQAQVSDPGLRQVLTPDHRIGCKRIVRSDDYLPAMARETTTVVTDPIDRIEPGGIVTSDGIARPADVLVYATGFRVAGSLAALPLTGRGGTTLQERWMRDGVRTHLGITVSGMPNLFLLSGPNTGLGHNSIVFMIESQIRYVLDAIRELDRVGAAALDVREDVQAASDAEVQGRLRRSVWSDGGCSSWYLDRGGRNHALWPGFSWRYRLRTRRVRLREHHLVGAG